MQPIPFRAIGRSLVRDLLIPWVISAILVTLVCLMMASLGMLSWPIAFVLFLFIAVQRQRLRDAEATRPPDALPDDEGLSREELLQRYGIGHNGRWYTVDGVDFDRLAEALAHGRYVARRKA